jgi:hypothetical protein
MFEFTSSSVIRVHPPSASIGVNARTATSKLILLREFKLQSFFLFFLMLLDGATRDRIFYLAIY